MDDVDDVIVIIWWSVVFMLFGEVFVFDGDLEFWWYFWFLCWVLRNCGWLWVLGFRVEIFVNVLLILVCVCEWNCIVIVDFVYFRFCCFSSWRWCNLFLMLIVRIFVIWFGVCDYGVKF